TPRRRSSSWPTSGSSVTCSPSSRSSPRRSRSARA
ncbi:MAG: Electron transfer flavoprotein, alpha subunit, partial [uncultured Frankineae bacterium]